MYLQRQGLSHHSTGKVASSALDKHSSHTIKVAKFFLLTTDIPNLV